MARDILCRAISSWSGAPIIHAWLRIIEVLKGRRELRVQKNETLKKERRRRKMKLVKCGRRMWDHGMRQWDRTLKKGGVREGACRRI
mgnify:CR=1 FL=1